jgi:hypothetical protein
MNVQVPMWGVCPMRSPVIPAEKSALVRGPQDPVSLLGPCLGGACGFWKVTKAVDGKPTEGMCGVRFLGEVFNSIAGSLEQLVQLQKSKTVEIPVERS